jgi:hypothetical protein
MLVGAASIGNLMHLTDDGANSGAIKILEHSDGKRRTRITRPDAAIPRFCALMC